MWTLKDIFFFIIVACIPTITYFFFEFDWLVLPNLPLVLLGTAVAFNVGFKNNNAYDRSWEARKIWGGIVNSSRTFSIMTLDFISNLFAEEKISEEELKAIKKKLIYRHIAWLTALRYQLRQAKPWEHFNHKLVKRIKLRFGNHVPEHTADIKDVIKEFISEDEMKDVLNRANTASYLIRNQSKVIAELREKHLIDDFRHMEFKKILEELYTLQGKSERIKNYPLPRQYASISYYFVMLFISILPFAMLGAFTGDGQPIWHVWLTIPSSVVVSWVFFTMEKIGDYSENPFEGVANDVPISSLAKTIEIDLKDMLNEDLPDPLKTQEGIAY